MIYGSVCSGIEAFSVATKPLGWQCRFVSELAPSPCKVLAHHYPDIPNLDDFTKIGVEHGPVDLLAGGTPCQSFSISGRGRGLDDPRGQLALRFIDLAKRIGARWFLWENVVGVLSSNRGRDFAHILATMGKCGFGFAYRILDAQFFGGAQQRRRVFVVGYSGDWRPPAAVLLEREGGGRDAAANRPTWGVPSGIARCLTAHGKRLDYKTETFPSGERRLTPVECERLQGFDDGYTDVPGVCEGDRYVMIGNSMHVPTIRWVAQRIGRVEAMRRVVEASK